MPAHRHTSEEKWTVRFQGSYLVTKLMYFLFCHDGVLRGLHLLEGFRPIRDRISKTLPASSTTLALSTMSMKAISKDNGTLKGTKDSSVCKHPEEHIRGYGGPHGRLHICDCCGSRWKENKETKQWDIMELKQSPTKLNPVKAPETKIASSSTPKPKGAHQASSSHWGRPASRRDLLR